MPGIRIAVDASQAKQAKREFANATNSIQRDSKKVEKAGSHMTNQMASLSRAIKGVGIAAASYLTFRAAIGGIRSTITAASALEETMNKFNVVFRGMQEDADKWTENLQENFNMSEVAARSYLSAVQDMLVPMGLARQEAGRLSNKIVELAADIGSFNDMPTAQVMGDIQSALVGQYEPMMKYGVVLRASTVQQRALNMGLADTKDELTAANKAMAAYKMIMEGSADAVGDVSRSQGSYAYETRRLQANIEDLKTEIGKGLLPVFSEMLENTNKWIAANDEFLKQEIPAMVEGFAGGVTTAASAMAELASNTRRAYIFANAFFDPGAAGREAMAMFRDETDEINKNLKEMQGFDLQAGISGLEGVDRLTDRTKETGDAAEETAKSIQTLTAKTDKMGQSVDAMSPAFLNVVNDLEEQRKQLLMTERQWEKYQAVMESSVDPGSDRADEIRKMVDRVYDMRKAMEWDEQAGAPAGIGPQMAGEHDEEMRRILEQDESTRDRVGEGWNGLVDRMDDAFSGWANSYSSTLNDMLWDSELTFDGILESFGKMVTEMLIQSAMADVMGALFGSGDQGGQGGQGDGGKTGMVQKGASTVIDLIATYFSSAAAHGNVYSGGHHLTAYAKGGVVDRPTVFPMAEGAGIMSEAGPEAVMPLARTKGGDLGVKTEGGGQQTNQTKIINVLDPAIVGDYMATNEGEQVIMNIVQKNRDSI